MHTATGTRRRWAHSIGEVDSLRSGVLVLGCLALYVGVLAVGATTLSAGGRHGALRPGAVRGLMAFSVALLLSALALVVTAATPNTQCDDSKPEKTWRDYASDTSFRKKFRFAASDMPRLITALGLDADEAAGNCREVGYTFSADTAISVLLFTFTTGATLNELNQKFGLKRSKASAVLQWSTRTVYDRWHKSLLCTDFRRWAPHFPEWAEAVFKRQGRLEGYRGIVAFVDGTFFATCRPKNMLQRFFFSGHKWKHGVHFQGVLAPIGLLIDFCGPFEGRHTDRWMLKVSKLLERFEDCMVWATTQAWGAAEWVAQIFYLFGDAGYNRRAYLQTQHSGGHLTAAQTSSICNLCNMQFIAVVDTHRQRMDLWPDGEVVGVPVAQERAENWARQRWASRDSGSNPDQRSHVLRRREPDQ